MPELGKRMKAIREQKGLTLEEAGEQLNIKCEDLTALEAEDFLSFPDRQFASTVLELYAVFLGMNKEEVNREFSGIWSEYGPLRSLFKKRKPKRTKEILATETAEIPETREELEKVAPKEEEPKEFEPQEPAPEEIIPEEVTEEEDIFPQVLLGEALPEEIILVEAAATKEEAPPKKKFPVFAVAAILVVGVGAFAFWQSQNPSEAGSLAAANSNVAEQASSDNQQPEPVETAKPVPTEEQPAEEAPKPSLEPDEITTQTVEEKSIAVEVTTPRGECWVEVVADGEQVYYQLVPPDTEPLTFKAKEEISILIGDAAAARINCNGEDLGVLGNRAVVVKRVFMSEN